MATINISIPATLKTKAEEAINLGLYSSFSDFVRTAMREHLTVIKYNIMAEEAKKEMRDGKGVLIETDEDLKNYFLNLKKKINKSKS